MNREKMRNGKKMQAARVFPYLLFLLSLILAGREAPEIARLADDISNDGMAVSCVREAWPRVISRSSIPLPKYFNRAKRVFLSTATNGSPSVFGPSISGQHVLRVLCVQRK
jgi:hypothetical protein